jgi:hypothetical protein
MAMKTRNLPGIEWTEIEGGPNCGEMITVSNSLTNGLRIEIFNDDIDDLGLFHVVDATIAVQIAQLLVEYAQRIANPPQPARPAEAKDGEFDEHLACANWPNCDLYGCGD